MLGLADDETVDWPRGRIAPVGRQRPRTGRLATNSKMKQACKGHGPRIWGASLTWIFRAQCRLHSLASQTALSMVSAEALELDPAVAARRHRLTSIPRQTTIRFAPRTSFCSLAVRCEAQRRHQCCTATDRRASVARWRVPVLGPPVHRCIAISRWTPELSQFAFDVIDPGQTAHQIDEPFERDASPRLNLSFEIICGGSAPKWTVCRKVGEDHAGSHLVLVPCKIAPLLPRGPDRRGNERPSYHAMSGEPFAQNDIR
ncbi:hypothetical protein CC86DRAFT_24251 [Ophiobolus disseminans]|uniref:Uncharacterized protein n=1 Tax=Ophiobolus disseminans TaxID=1469910 RepID=A0A6A7A2Y4_9PLEO|nr:hypothetical protein CC86DRAFT_24251 [Ophiobolus disseminans]